MNTQQSPERRPVERQETLPTPSSPEKGTQYEALQDLTALQSAEPATQVEIPSDAPQPEARVSPQDSLPAVQARSTLAVILGGLKENKGTGELRGAQSLEAQIGEAA